MTQHTIDMGASMETDEGLAIIDALNEVSDILAMDGPRVTFFGDGPESVGATGRLTGVHVYRCPRGVFVLFQEADGPHWAVSGASASDVIEQIRDNAIRAHVARHLSAT
ncbi:MAG: hypothetical protein ACR2NO_08040 [Chloroflexota bacterium]